MWSLALQSDAFTVLPTIPLKGLPQLQWVGQAARDTVRRSKYGAGILDTAEKVPMVPSSYGAEWYVRKLGYHKVPR